MAESSARPGRKWRWSSFFASRGDSGQIGAAGRAVTIVVLALLLLGVLLAGAAIDCPAAACRARQFDLAGLARAAAWHSPGGNTLFMALTWLGSLFVLLPLAIVHAGWSGRRRGWPVAALVPVSVLSAAAVAHLAKWWFARPRPEMPSLIAMPADWSYPSAHAMQATAFALAIGIAAAGRRPSAALAVGLLLLVVAVGLSRIYLQVHFPSDVIVGVMAGALCALLTRQLLLPGGRGAH